MELPSGVLAQLVERLNGIEEVRGSNPLGSTSFGKRAGSGFRSGTFLGLSAEPCRLFTSPRLFRPSMGKSLEDWGEATQRNRTILKKRGASFPHLGCARNYIQTGVPKGCSFSPREL